MHNRLVSRHIDALDQCFLVSSGSLFVVQICYWWESCVLHCCVYIYTNTFFFSTTLSDYKATKPVRQFVGGINDRKLLLQACQGVSCVIHIAGIIDVSMFPDEQKLKRVNVQGRYLNEPQCKKKVQCAHSEDFDQPAHSHSLVRIFAAHFLDSQGCKVSSCRQRRLWSDWLMCVGVGHPCKKVWFLSLRLK